MPTAYDPRVIQQFADRLYLEARTVVGLATALGVVVGAFVGYVGGQVSGGMGAAGALTGVCILGLAGLAIGAHRAASLRLQAQVALCQLQIEWNTRRS